MPDLISPRIRRLAALTILPELLRYQQLAGWLALCSPQAIVTAQGNGSQTGLQCAANGDAIRAKQLGKPVVTNPRRSSARPVPGQPDS